MKSLYKLLILMISFAMHLIGILQIVNYTTMSGLLGTSVTSFLTSYGITQIIFGVILLFIALAIFVLFVIILIQEVNGKQPNPEVQKLGKDYVKFKAWAAHMEKAYGTNWMQSQETIASAISSSKKK